MTTNLAVTMRTPGHENELAVGLLLAEGVIRGREELVDVRALGNEPSNEMLVELARGADFEAWRLARNGFVSSSCGVCGKRSREAVQQDVPVLEADEFRVGADVIHSLPAALRSHQPGFAETGGLHAAALFTATGKLEAALEDIGRHNALDKLTGWAFLNGRSAGEWLEDKITICASGAVLRRLRHSSTSMRRGADTLRMMRWGFRAAKNMASVGSPASVNSQVA